MLYRKDNQIFTRSAAIANIIEQLHSVVEPAYIDDETLSMYGFEVADELVNTSPTAPSQAQRKLVLESVDWVTGAKQLSDQTKESVEAWRWLVRNLPQINPQADIPPLPKLKAIPNYFATSELSSEEIEQIKNYVTSDDGWLTFLEIWKDFNFVNLRYVVTNLLSAYTNVTLDEVISSI